MRDLRFSCNVFAVRSRDQFMRYCQDAERYGYDTVFTADHLGSPAPFPPLVLAAEATERLRVGVLVLNVPFWNAHVRAREVATVDVLTGGRLELGLGAGHMKWEFDAAGIPWAPHPGPARGGQAAHRRRRLQPRPRPGTRDAVPADRHHRGDRGPASRAP